MSFLYPAWLAALVIVPVLIIATVLVRRNKTRIWEAFVSKKHQNELVTKNKPLKFWLSLGFSCIGLSCIIIAMARPHSGESVSREKIESRNILIAVDTSLSMLCEDVQPNRLSSGVGFAVNLISELPNDHFGVMAYAGTPNVITSFSIDHPSIIEELGQLSPQSTHIAGSNLTDTLHKGISTLKQAGKQANALVLITDGSEKLEEIKEIISIAREAYVQIFTIGVGTNAGGTIPVNGEPHRDTKRNVVITKLQDSILRQLASETTGIYTHINSQPELAITEAIQKMNYYEKQGREVQIPNELYQWFLAPGLLFLFVGSFIKVNFKSSFPNIFTFIIFSIFAFQSESIAQETSWAETIKTEYHQRPALIKSGYNALTNKDYETAITDLTEARAGTTGTQHAQLSLAIAQAAYRQKNYTLASKEYSQALRSPKAEVQSTAQYNLANTLLRKETQDFNLLPKENLTDYFIKQLKTKKLTEQKLKNIQTGLTNASTHYNDLLKTKPNHRSAKANNNTAQNIIKAIDNAIKVRSERKKKAEKEKKSNEQKDKQKSEDKKETKDKKESEDKKGSEDKKEPENKQKSYSSEFSNKEEALNFLKKHSDKRKKPPSNIKRYYKRPTIDW